jgi:hypothetical protein
VFGLETDGDGLLTDGLVGGLVPGLVFLRRLEGQVLVSAVEGGAVALCHRAREGDGKVDDLGLADALGVPGWDEVL